MSANERPESSIGGRRQRSVGTEDAGVATVVTALDRPSCTRRAPQPVVWCERYVDRGPRGAGRTGSGPVRGGRP